MRHFVYILETLSSHYYIGSTGSLKRRINEHAKGHSNKTTKENGYRRILYAEMYPDRSSAEKRERQIKGWSRIKKLALINGDFGELKNLAKRRVFHSPQIVSRK